MTVVPYYLRLRKHLELYKRDVLGISEKGTWSYRGKRIAYPHILPAAQHRLNVLDVVRDEFWAYWEYQTRHGERPAKLHRNFAHLTSSQALAFNLFFPLLGSSRANPDALLLALGIAPEPVRAWRFEDVLDSEEGTNFDVTITLASGRRVLVEAKLTEREFGTCRNDPRHRDKLARIYGPRLAGKVRDEATCVPAFFDQYQVLRNIAYADEKTSVIFLVPRANEALSGVAEFIDDSVLAPYRVVVRVVYLEDVVTHLRASAGLSSLAADLAALAEKYVPEGGRTPRST